MALARSEDDRQDRAVRAAAVAAAAFCLVLAGYVLWRSAVLTPYSDEIDWVQRWIRLKADHDWAAYLLTPHNTHRLVWTFLFLGFDLGVFRGVNWPLVVSAAAALAVMAGLLARQAAQAAEPGLRTPAGALALMLALMPGNVLDASTPICADYPHAAVFAVAAIILAEGAAQASPWRRGGALPAAMASAFGCAAGLAAWPALAWGAIRRRDWRWLAILVVVGAGFGALYMAGQAPAGQGAVTGALADPASAVRLSVSFLALPWARLAPAWAWAPGAVLGLVALALVLPRDLRQASPATRVACCLIVFTLGTAAMAGLGRASAAAAVDVPLRYAVFTTPLQIGVLILALPAIGRLWRSRPGAVRAGALALVFALCVQDVAMAHRAVQVSDMIRGLLAEFEAGRTGPEVSTTVYPDLPRATRLTAIMHGEGLFRPQPASAPSTSATSTR